MTDKYDMGAVPIYSLPFDVHYAPKPAFWAMVGVLNGSTVPFAREQRTLAPGRVS